MVLTHNTQWLRPISPSGVTPEDLPVTPTAMSVLIRLDALRVWQMASCRRRLHGALLPQVFAGDIQFKGVAGTLDVDSAFLTQNKALHQTYYTSARHLARV